VKCYNCEHKQTIPGDCHILCKNPPSIQLQIGSGGDERYKQATEQALKVNAVVRCIWPGSGYYPFCFDANTVFGCVNFKEVK